MDLLEFRAPFFSTWKKNVKENNLQYPLEKVHVAARRLKFLLIEAGIYPHICEIGPVQSPSQQH